MWNQIKKKFLKFSDDNSNQFYLIFKGFFILPLDFALFIIDNLKKVKRVSNSLLTVKMNFKLQIHHIIGDEKINAQLIDASKAE